MAEYRGENNLAVYDFSVQRIVCGNAGFPKKFLCKTDPRSVSPFPDLYLQIRHPPFRINIV